jgi:hypothetical protein
MRDMVGLVLGVIVKGTSGVQTAGKQVPPRRVRLVAESDASPRSGRDTLPRMHFVLDDRGRMSDTHAQVSPELELVRGEPVAITIVNHLDEPTVVHWHGIEVEDSYMDGAAGFSGAGEHLAPAIAPGDSFVARFTPPRSGTFMYHAHVDEKRQELAGLEGVLIVRDPGRARSPDDNAFLLKGSLNFPLYPLELNGTVAPDTVVVHVGRTARFRLLNLTDGSQGLPRFTLTARPDSALTLTKDTMVVSWRPVAKDGFDLTGLEQETRPADQTVGIGETFDFDYTPSRPGLLRLEVRARGGQRRLLVHVPIRVE